MNAVVNSRRLPPRGMWGLTGLCATKRILYVMNFCVDPLVVVNLLTAVEVVFYTLAG